MSDPVSNTQGTRIECAASERFSAWLAEAGGSLVVTTYQAGKVALIGWDGRQISLLMRHFDKPLGLAIDGTRMALACRHEVLLFSNDPRLAHDYLADQPGRYDALFMPQAAYFTGELNTHDVMYGAGGLWLMATRFSCLAALSDEFSFVPRWQPKFITELVPEDRCHLNGLAMREGQPNLVTALGESNQVGGWRSNKATGGVLIDVASQETVLRGLSMPHSPRWHARRLWVLNSGAGELCVIDPESGRHEVISTLPGYLRGLCFVQDFALVGLCQIREQHIFGGLLVQERFKKLLCGIAVIDLRTGQQVGLFEFTAGCQELYDVQFLPGVLRPNILNPQSEAARQAVSAPGFSYWLRRSSLVEDATDVGPPN